MGILKKKIEKLNLRLDADTFSNLRFLQRKSGRNVSDMIRVIINDSYSRYEYYQKMYGEGVDKDSKEG